MVSYFLSEGYVFDGAHIPPCFRQLTGNITEYAITYENNGSVPQYPRSDCLEMLPVIYGFLRVYAPYITLPVAAVIGFIGYKIENYVSDKYTPYQESIEGKREQRHLEENLSKDLTQVESLKEKKFVPRSVLERNLSPSLLEEMNKEK